MFTVKYFVAYAIYYLPAWLIDDKMESKYIS